MNNKSYLISYIFIILIAGLWPFNFLAQNNAGFGNNGSLHISPPAAVYTPVPPQKLLNINRFTILINLSSEFEGSNGHGGILNYSLDYEHQNFMAGQWKDGLFFRLKAADNEKMIHIGAGEVFKKGEKTWLAIVYDGDSLYIYKDGKIKNRRQVGTLNFSNWDASYPLVIGSEANGSSSWSGNLWSVSIYDMAFPEEKIKNFSMTSVMPFDETYGNIDVKPLIHYSFKESRGTAVRDAGKGRPADLFIPVYYKPFKRPILEKTRTVSGEYRFDRSDILINIIGFMPFGFLLSACLTEKRLPFMAVMILCVSAGFAISLTIEILQVFLPTRSSDMMDLITNTLGTGLGCVIQRSHRKSKKRDRV